MGLQSIVQFADRIGFDRDTSELPDSLANRLVDEAAANGLDRRIGNEAISALFTNHIGASAVAQLEVALAKPVIEEVQAHEALAHNMPDISVLEYVAIQEADRASIKSDDRRAYREQIAYTNSVKVSTFTGVDTQEYSSVHIRNVIAQVLDMQLDILKNHQSEENFIRTKQQAFGVIQFMNGESQQKTSDLTGIKRDKFELTTALYRGVNRLRLSGVTKNDWQSMFDGSMTEEELDQLRRRMELDAGSV